MKGKKKKIGRNKIITVLLYKYLECVKIFSYLGPTFAYSMIMDNIIKFSATYLGPTFATLYWGMSLTGIIVYCHRFPLEYIINLLLLIKSCNEVRL